MRMHVACIKLMKCIMANATASCTVLMLMQKREDRENRVNCNFVLLHPSYENPYEI